MERPARPAVRRPPASAFSPRCGGAKLVPYSPFWVQDDILTIPATITQNEPRASTADNRHGATVHRTDALQQYQLARAKDALDGGLASRSGISHGRAPSRTVPKSTNPLGEPPLTIFRNSSLF